jgi:glycosyltransferase involved in cell wall biosynthesis
LRRSAEHTALYVGILDESKGIGDTLRAIAKLKDEGIRIALKVAGQGQKELYEAMARDLMIDDRIEFLGLRPHAQILDMMREADFVVVPSRHEYPEGFPMTIYETLCSRTPLIASDHPMFRGNLTHHRDAWIFSAGNADSLAAGMRGLLSDPDLYRRLSTGSAEAWARLQLPVKWHELIKRWVSDAPEDRNWFFEHRMSSGIYPLHRYQN